MSVEKLFVWSSLVTFVGVLSLISYWLFIQPSDIIYDMQYSKGPSEIVQAGSTLVIKRWYCVRDNAPTGRVQRFIQDGIIYLLPEITTHGTPGCHERTFLVELPNQLYPGDYLYKTKITYQLNPLRQVTFDLPIIPFKVENKLYRALGAPPVGRK